MQPREDKEELIRVGSLRPLSQVKGEKRKSSYDPEVLEHLPFWVRELLKIIEGMKGKRNKHV